MYSLVCQFFDYIVFLLTILDGAKTMKKKSDNFKPKAWTQKEIRRLKRLYPMNHNKDIAKMFDRTTISILGKAKKLGLQKDWDGGYRVPPSSQNENLWTQKDINILRKMYLNSSNDEIAKKLNRSCQAVQTKVKKLGLFQEFKQQGLFRNTKNGKGLWADEEIDTLKKLHLAKTAAQIAEKLGRTSKAVGIMARRLGLSTTRSMANAWTVEDDAFLEKHIAKWPLEKIAKKLERTPCAVQRRAWQKHFLRNCPNQQHTQQQIWTKQDIKKLEYWLLKYSNDEIAEKLGRSRESVIAKMKRLGLKRSSFWTRKNIAILKKYFPFETNVKVAKRLGKNPASIRFKAIKLGLKKSVRIQYAK